MNDGVGHKYLCIAWTFIALCMNFYHIELKLQAIKEKSYKICVFYIIWIECAIRTMAKHESQNSARAAHQYHLKCSANKEMARETKNATI